MATTPNSQVIEFLVNHVLLPVKLPQQDDDLDTAREGERSLLGLLIGTAKTFIAKCNIESHHMWRPLCSVLENMRVISEGNTTPKEPLQKIIQGLEPTDAVTVHIRAQNAALLFFRPESDSVVVHAFEASARSDDVMGSCDRLAWNFPGQSVSFSSHLLNDKNFVEEVASIVHKMSNEPVELSMSTTRKAQSIVPEERETTHPRLVTEALVQVLKGCGKTCESLEILKHVRDDVNWDKCLSPWRRSPFWLVIRVSMQILLSHAFNTEQGRWQYKNLMAFFMARVCDFVISNPVSADVRQIAAVKAARRLSKLGGNALPFVEKAVSTVVTKVQTSLDASWLKYQEQDSPPILKLRALAMDDDYNLPLSNSHEYLRMVAQRGGGHLEQPIIELTAGHLLKFKYDGLPQLQRAEDAFHRIFLLTDFETWTIDNLASWTENRLGNDSDCESLLQGMRTYVDIALEEYRDNPRALSVMLLTLLEIWKALDTICLRLYPLMQHYTPEIPENIGHPLLLPHLCQLKSLDRIERHLAARWRDVDPENPPILGNLTNRSICVPYFAQSERHQNLKKEIEHDASERRARKYTEWEEKSNSYRLLLEQASRMQHSYATDEWGDPVHQSSCHKCARERQAAAIRIEVDEWPLPADNVQAKAAVFELDCPVGFSSWRDATWIILQDVGRTESLLGGDILERLLNYKLLKRYASDRGRRITLGSRTKTFLRSHYSSQRFPIAFEKVAVNNGLQYRLLDRNTNCWLQDQTSTAGFDRHCVSSLPGGPYSNLQDFMDTTTRTPNEALARQQDCHVGISSHEFVAFASLRAGERIQLLNVLRELGSADLSFNAPAVHMLIRQAIFQAGSSSGHSVFREAHMPFKGLAFGLRLLCLLEDHLSSVRANWKEQTRLATIVILSIRTLSLCRDSSLTSRVVQLLREVRKVALEWCRNISDSLQNCETQDENNKLRNVILESAITCRMTFGIDFNCVHLVLSDDADVASFVESSIYLNDNCPVQTSSLPTETRNSLFMDRKISRTAESHLITLIKASSSGINNGLERAYGLTGFEGCWNVFAATQDRWMTCSIRTNSYGARQPCHYDVLTGEFLLDGRRVGRLPAKYTNAPIYERIFGPRILNVTKSYIPCMEYKTIKMIDGHEVHLGMRSGELLIEAVAGTKHLRLIPYEILEPDLPKNLTEDFVHWINTKTNEIEFHSLSSPWGKFKRDMTLHLLPDRKSYMKVGKKRLVDQKSRLGNAVLDILQILENRHYVMITADSEEVNVHLPRFRLSLFINKHGLLESKQLGAVIDLDQNIGCLYGLRNKLVFRSLNSHPSILERSVVIPYGPVSISKYGDYSRAVIRLGSAKQIRFMHYQLDENLSRLRGHPGVVSKLYLAYLHAVTSSGLPDPLTSHSGTHEALRILHEQSLRVSTPMENDAISMLNLIAALTPERRFYPKHLRRMQTVKWQPSLGQLAQHEDFATLVEDISNYSSQLGILYDGQCARSLVKSRGDAQLLKRATNRSSSVRNTILGSRRRHDEVYKSRDDNSNSPGARRVFEISSLVRQWPREMDVVLDLPSRVKQWQLVGGYNQNIDPLRRTCNDLLAFPLDQEWGAVYDYCRKSQREADQYKLMHLFAMIVFAQAESMPLVRTLLGIACSGTFFDIRTSKCSYNIGQGDGPTHAQVRSIVERYIPEPTRTRGENKQLWRSRLAEFRSEKSKQLDFITNHLMEQRHCDSPSIPQLGSMRLKFGATEDCTKRFTTWNDNRKFMLHINEVQSKLRKIYSSHVGVLRETPSHKPRQSCDMGAVLLAPELMDLFCERSPPLPPQPSVPYHSERPSQPPRHTAGLHEFEEMIKRMREDDDTRQRYANDLQASLASFKATKLAVTPERIPVYDEDLLDCKVDLSNQMRDALRQIVEALGPQSSSEHVLYKTGLWPRINTASLLMCLSAQYRSSIPEAWRRVLASFGELVSSLQRSERLLALSHRNDILGFYKEAEEPGHQSWNGNEYPDWLLIEIENNLTIREIQAEVARKMIWADDGKNAVLQLNMGEGKSSVIVPMVMTELSNGQQLARIIVIKPLLKQTQNLLSQRLGGLVNRRICHAPVTRERRLDNAQISQLLSHLEQCFHDQGIVITLPEHMMSFRLMGRERLQTQPELGWQLIRVEQWLATTCRDVLDESDEILDPRFQLVYSIGNQRLMDGQPDRWIITQRLLSLFADQAQLVQDEGNQGVEVDFWRRSYPMITFLDHSVGSVILDRVVKEISCGNLVGISLAHCTSAVRQAVEEFIRERSASKTASETVEQEFSGTESWEKLHLLRGLIAHNILLFAFQQKRWLVNYGLDLSRCMMAVPYRAKGVPSISAEFGHPDVAIVLTCLSYYYSGLTSTQLRQAFGNLSRESDPPSEYALWTRDCHDLRIQSFHGVNLEDEQLWKESIFPHLQYSKSAADYFMTSVVFPHEGKEFPAKLSTSAWDIPSEVRSTTGFSGTNDNKFLLPLSISQQDLPQLHRTNAMVISTLLRVENRGYLEAKDDSGKRLDTEGLLGLVCAQEPSIQVLIDVGAQVLESTNHNVAKEWLRLSLDAKAAVYFDASDELLVLDRQGFVERLFASPFHRNLDSCLIYLDEVHTRGVDLSMPTHARAAVTLGPRTTKDRLVQACMRLRMLGCHQSLMFLAPPEVHREVFALSGKQPDATLDSADVVSWCFEQTCRATSNMKPLWIMQGLEHSHRRRLCTDFLQHDDLEDMTIGPGSTSDFCSRIQEPEARSLQKMYGTGSKKAVFRPCLTDREARQDSTVRLLLSEWAAFTEGQSKDWALQEEQEREIAHEVEQEREIQRPPPADALPHRLDDLVLCFIRTGRTADPTIIPFSRAFDSLRLTSAYQHLHAGVVAGTLCVTEDFINTVRITPNLSYDDFIRPVKWVLSSRSDPHFLLVISPYEANIFLPEIRESSEVRLHVYSAKTSKTMHQFDDLNFYTVSATLGTYVPGPLLIGQVALFASSLFFEDFALYKLVCDFLAILTEEKNNKKDVRVGSDGFVDREARKCLDWPVESPFEKSPVVFFKFLIGIRRKGHLYSQTHLGHLLSGRPFTEAGFRRA